MRNFNYVDFFAGPVRFEQIDGRVLARKSSSEINSVTR